MSSSETASFNETTSWRSCSTYLERASPGDPVAAAPHSVDLSRNLKWPTPPDTLDLPVLFIAHKTFWGAARKSLMWNRGDLEAWEGFKVNKWCSVMPDLSRSGFEWESVRKSWMAVFLKADRDHSCFFRKCMGVTWLQLHRVERGFPQWVAYNLIATWLHTGLTGFYSGGASLGVAIQTNCFQFWFILCRVCVHAYQSLILCCTEWQKETDFFDKKRQISLQEWVYSLFLQQFCTVWHDTALSQNQLEIHGLQA